MRARRKVSQNAIAVFGGSGLLGSEVVYQSLQAGEQVACLVRDKRKLVIPKGTGGPRAGGVLSGATVIEVIRVPHSLEGGMRIAVRRRRSACGR